MKYTCTDRHRYDGDSNYTYLIEKCFNKFRYRGSTLGMYNIKQLFGKGNFHPVY